MTETLRDEKTGFIDRVHYTSLYERWSELPRKMDESLRELQVSEQMYKVLNKEVNSSPHMVSSTTPELFVEFSRLSRSFDYKISSKASWLQPQNHKIKVTLIFTFVTMIFPAIVIFHLLLRYEFARTKGERPDRELFLVDV